MAFIEVWQNFNIIFGAADFCTTTILNLSRSCITPPLFGSLCVVYVMNKRILKRQDNTSNVYMTFLPSSVPVGRRPLVEDDLHWKMTFCGPLCFLPEGCNQKIVKMHCLFLKRVHLI